MPCHNKMDPSSASAAVFGFDCDHNMLLTLGGSVQQGCHTRPRLDSETGRCIPSAPSTAASNVDMTSSCEHGTTVKVLACQMHLILSQKPVLHIFHSNTAAPPGSARHCTLSWCCRSRPGLMPCQCTSAEWYTPLGHIPSLELHTADPSKHCLKHSRRTHKSTDLLDNIFCLERTALRACTRWCRKGCCPPGGTRSSSRAGWWGSISPRS